MFLYLKEQDVDGLLRPIICLTSAGDGVKPWCLLWSKQPQISLYAT